MVNFGYPYNDIVICKDSTDYLVGECSSSVSDSSLSSVEWPCSRNCRGQHFGSI